MARLRVPFANGLMDRWCFFRLLFPTKALSIGQLVPGHISKARHLATRLYSDQGHFSCTVTSVIRDMSGDGILCLSDIVLDGE